MFYHMSLVKFVSSYQVLLSKEAEEKERSSFVTAASGATTALTFCVLGSR